MESGNHTLLQLLYFHTVTFLFKVYLKNRETARELLSAVYKNQQQLRLGQSEVRSQKLAVVFHVSVRSPRTSSAASRFNAKLDLEVEAATTPWDSTIPVLYPL